MSSRWQRYLSEGGRFFAVGGVATTVSLVLFNLLVHGFGAGAPLSDQPVVALVAANLVGMGVSYHGSRTWVFRDRPPRQSDGGVTAFLAINAVTMLIPIGCLMVSRDVLGLDDPISDNVSANVIGLTLAFLARFYLFRTFVFQRPLDAPPAAEPSTGQVTGQVTGHVTGHVTDGVPTRRSTSVRVPPAAP